MFQPQQFIAQYRHNAVQSSGQHCCFLKLSGCLYCVWTVQLEQYWLRVNNETKETRVLTFLSRLRQVSLNISAGGYLSLLHKPLSEPSVLTRSQWTPPLPHTHTLYNILNIISVNSPTLSFLSNWQRRTSSGKCYANVNIKKKKVLTKSFYHGYHRSGVNSFGFKYWPFFI